MAHARAITLGRGAIGEPTWPDLLHAGHTLLVLRPGARGAEHTYPRGWSRLPRGIIASGAQSTTVTAKSAVALLTGRGIDAIDLDTLDTHALDDVLAVLAEHHIPVIATVTTHRGAHVWLPSAGLRSSACPTSHIDYRGAGGSITLPGSYRRKHHAHPYAWATAWTRGRESAATAIALADAGYRSRVLAALTALGVTRLPRPAPCITLNNAPALRVTPAPAQAPASGGVLTALYGDSRLPRHARLAAYALAARENAWPLTTAIAHAETWARTHGGAKYPPAAIATEIERLWGKPGAGGARADVARTWGQATTTMGLPASEYALARALAIRAHASGRLEMRTSHRLLAIAAGISRAATATALTALTDRGWVSVSTTRAGLTVRLIPAPLTAPSCAVPTAAAHDAYCALPPGALRVIDAARPVTAAQVAAFAGVSVVAARACLTALADAGLLTFHPGGRGRGRAATWHPIGDDAAITAALTAHAHARMVTGHRASRLTQARDERAAWLAVRAQAAALAAAMAGGDPGEEGDEGDAGAPREACPWMEMPPTWER